MQPQSFNMSVVVWRRPPDRVERDVGPGARLQAEPPRVGGGVARGTADGQTEESGTFGGLPASS